jgi:competence ComEA-like helix-hairpin-helix protein
MGLMDRDYMRRPADGSRGNSVMAWLRRSSLTEILSASVLALSLISGAIWLFRDLGWSWSSASHEGTLRVNVNTATLDELETVPGIGPALAELIVAGRPYESVDDLERVRGIGPQTVESLRPFVKTSGETESLR